MVLKKKKKKKSFIASVLYYGTSSFLFPNLFSLYLALYEAKVAWTYLDTSKLRVEDEDLKKKRKNSSGKIKPCMFLRGAEGSCLAPNSLLQDFCICLFLLILIISLKKKKNSLYFYAIFFIFIYFLTRLLIKIYCCFLFYFFFMHSNWECLRFFPVWEAWLEGLTIVKKDTNLLTCHEHWRPLEE